MPNNKKTKECHFCVNNVKDIDYKDINTLVKFINYHQKILAGSRTGVCSWHQRKLTTAIKRARKIALLAFTSK